MAAGAPTAPPLGEGVLRRERRRVRGIAASEDDRKRWAERVCRQYEQDLEARSEDRAIRLERYAKYRQWRAPDDGWPWPGSSNQAIPDMMEASIRMQDTLHNAVMSARPVVVSRALDPKDEPKQRAIDALHDTQLFVEQNGEKLVEHAAESFVNDPAVTFHVVWITERREVRDVRVFDPIPEDRVPRSHFEAILRRTFPSPRYQWEATDEEGWDWEVFDESAPNDTPRRARFYAQEGRRVELVLEWEPVVYDGPSIRVMSYDDVVTPPGVSNLGIPSPSNPGGAPHVILVEQPTKEELVRLATGRRDEPAFYDLVGAEQREHWPGVTRTRDHDEAREQKDALAGEQSDPERLQDDSHGTLTRLVCFDTVDVDGDGQAEDVVFWVLYETRELLRARYLTEVFPGPRPERPLVDSSFLPVGGRRAGISLLESMEGLHDFLKETVDQMVDNGTLANLPWFTYRASSSVKPETLRPGPGDGIPLNDPRNDIAIQQFRSDGQVYGLNMAAFIRQLEERLTLQGDLQSGRVPTGGSSALRTLGGIQTLLSQGDARPERILRRFFMAFHGVFRLMHRYNRYFLPTEKSFRAPARILDPKEDPYFQVKAEDVDVDLEFDFHANVLNSSRQALQASLQQLAAAYITPLALQLGISTPDTIFRLLKDLGEALGQVPVEKGYLSPPSPTAMEPGISAEEAVMELAEGVLPTQPPLEGAQAHLQALQEIQEWESFQAEFPSQHLSLLRAYMEQVAQQAQQEAQLLALAQAAGEGNGLPGRAGRPPEGPPLQPQGQPMLEAGELLDESLPTAGGGASQ